MSEIKYIGQMSSSQNSRVIDPEGISYAVTNGHKDGEPKIIERDTPMKGNYTEPIIIDDYNQRVPQDQDVIGTVTTQFGNPAPRHGYKIAEPLRIPQATKQGYIEVPQGAVFDMSYPESTTRRGRVQEGGQVSPTLMSGGEAPCYFEGVEAKVKQIGNLVDDSNRKFKNPQTGRIYDTDGLSPTVNTCQDGGREPKIATSYRIRKLTPRECFRLMGVTEDDIDKIQQSGVSNSQQYKMAGNSIVVDVMYYIFKNMFAEEKGNTTNNSGQLSLF